MPTISDHLLDSNCSVDFDHFNISTSDPNKFKYLPAEILLKKRDLIQLSKSIKSIPSKLLYVDIYMYCLTVHNHVILEILKLIKMCLKRVSMSF